MMKMNVETKAVYEKYGTSMTGGCLQLVIQLPILLALYRVIYNIPAYVCSVKTYFMQVVYAITNVSNIADLPEGAGASLLQFATDHNIPLTGITKIGDLVGDTGEVLGNKMVDILYKLNPEQWGELAKRFPDAAAVIAENSAAIEKMNSFLGINLATNPWQGFSPSIAWLIPIMAGVSQWLSAKLMMSNQPQQDENSTSAQMMKQMNVMMPLMSVFFCFTFASGIGIYWIAQSVIMIVQQFMLNRYFDKVDIDVLIQKNIEKANKKRAKRGLPPEKMNRSASETIRMMQERENKEEEKRMEKMAKTRAIVKDSTEYYNRDAKPGSLASKAAMVQTYNERNGKK